MGGMILFTIFVWIYVAFPTTDLGWPLCLSWKCCRCSGPVRVLPDPRLSHSPHHRRGVFLAHRSGPRPLGCLRPSVLSAWCWVSFSSALLTSAKSMFLSHCKFYFSCQESQTQTIECYLSCAPAVYSGGGLWGYHVVFFSVVCQSASSLAGHQLLSLAYRLLDAWHLVQCWTLSVASLSGFTIELNPMM